MNVQNNRYAPKTTDTHRGSRVTHARTIVSPVASCHRASASVRTNFNAAVNATAHSSVVPNLIPVTDATTTSPAPIPAAASTSPGPSERSRARTAVNIGVRLHAAVRWGQLNARLGLCLRRIL
jgi:hypothetical protein